MREETSNLLESKEVEDKAAAAPIPCKSVAIFFSKRREIENLERESNARKQEIQRGEGQRQSLYGDEREREKAEKLRQRSLCVVSCVGWV